MRRKFQIFLAACVAIFSVPLGGATAQSLAPIPVVPALTALNGVAALSKPTGKLSARLQALADSASLQTASVEAQAAALSMPARGAGSFITDPQGRLLVDIRLSQVSPSALAALSAAGAHITDVSPAYQMVTALVATVDLARLANVPAVANIMEELTPLHASALAAPVTQVAHAPASTCPQGTAVSEGDVQLNANVARTTYTVDGSGVKVGILSDSFNADATANTNAAQDIASGDLPGAANTCGAGFTTPVHVISETLSPGTATDEGRAMVQIVHDLAPKAALAFATAHNGIFQFGDNIRALRTWGADIIADDVTYFVEPMFQEGPVATAIRDVTAAGAVYMTSAANSNAIVGGQNVSSYEAPAYRPTAVPVFLGGGGYDSCHDFNPLPAADNTYGVTLGAGGSIVLILNWAQPWNGVTTDLDLLVTNATNGVVADSLNNNTGPSGTQVPFEFVSWANGTGIPQTYNIEVCRFVGGTALAGTPRLKWVMLQSHGLLAVEYPVSLGGDTVGPTIMGHSASLYSLSVAAAQYNNNNSPETFSSRGPATHYFGPVSGNTPAAAIAPLVIHQPDFTATDGGCTTFFLQFSAGCYRFFGTSAAAPHAAGVAALLKQKANQNGLIPITQGTAKFLLKATAQNMSGGTPESVGAGLIDALGVIAKELLFTHHLELPLLKR
jgi:hypothetical protein